MLISNILSEACVFVIFIASFFFFENSVKGLEDYLEKVIIGCVWSSIIGQFLISLYWAFKGFHKAWKRIEMIRAKKFLEKVNFALNNPTQTSFK